MIDFFRKTVVTLSLAITLAFGTMAIGGAETVPIRSTNVPKVEDTSIKDFKKHGTGSEQGTRCSKHNPGRRVSGRTGHRKHSYKVLCRDNWHMWREDNRDGFAIKPRSRSFLTRRTFHTARNEFSFSICPIRIIRNQVSAN